METKGKVIKLQFENTKLKDKLLNSSIENCNLIGIIDDMQEEFLYILENIAEILSNNNYGNTEIKNRKAIEYVEKQIYILEKDIEISNKNELSLTPINR